MIVVWAIPMPPLQDYLHCWPRDENQKTLHHCSIRKTMTLIVFVYEFSIYGRCVM